jgi:hypothetical protein
MGGVFSLAETWPEEAETKPSFYDIALDLSF